jgi:hypothetical protein
VPDEGTQEAVVRILMIEGEPGAAGAVTAQLVDAGHAVARCHDVGDLGFACNGMLEDRGCPLDDGPVDAAVVLRGRPSATATTSEAGVRCALRRHVPVVLAGDHSASPYTPYASAVADGDVLGAIEQAAASPLPRHSEAAQVALREALDHHDLADVDAEASVVHVGGDLSVHLVAGAPIPRPLAEMAAVRAAGAVRALDPHPRTVDVRVEPVLEGS